VTETFGFFKLGGEVSGAIVTCASSGVRNRFRKKVGGLGERGTGKGIGNWRRQSDVPPDDFKKKH